MNKQDTIPRRGAPAVKAITIVLVALLLIVLTAGVAVARDIRGTNGPDNLAGTSKADEINARDGNDEVRGLGGPDALFGGAGSDVMRGGVGDDRLSGTPGNDTAVGNGGDDAINGGVGKDKLEGRGGNDQIVAAGDGDRDEVNCGDGARDVAEVDLNDVVDGELVSSVLGVGNLVGTIGSCDRVELRILQ